MHISSVPPFVCFFLYVQCTNMKGCLFVCMTVVVCMLVLINHLLNSLGIYYECSCVVITDIPNCQLTALKISLSASGLLEAYQVDAEKPTINLRLCTDAHKFFGLHPPLSPPVNNILCVKSC